MAINYKKEILRGPTSRTGPPELPGVYAVFIGKPKSLVESIVYIGSSSNMNKRLLTPNHIYRKLYDAFSYDFDIYTRCLIIDNYIEVEKMLIKHFQPAFNTHHR